MFFRQWLLIVGLLFFGCDSQPDVVKSPYSVNQQVEGLVFVRLINAYDKDFALDPGRFVLQVYNGGFACGGYELVADLTKKSKSIEIHIRGIQAPGPTCTGQLDSADESWDISTPSSDMNLLISLAQDTDRLLITKNDSILSLVQIDSTFTRVTNSSIHF